MTEILHNKAIKRLKAETANIFMDFHELADGITSKFASHDEELALEFWKSFKDSFKEFTNKNIKILENKILEENDDDYLIQEKEASSKIESKLSTLLENKREKYSEDFKKIFTLEEILESNPLEISNFDSFEGIQKFLKKLRIFTANLITYKEGARSRLEKSLILYEIQALSLKEKSYVERMQTVDGKHRKRMGRLRLESKVVATARDLMQEKAYEENEKKNDMKKWLNENLSLLQNYFIFGSELGDFRWLYDSISYKPYYYPTDANSGLKVNFFFLIFLDSNQIHF